ncbi:hypothetical protein [Streptomyces sp. NPDC058861]|uniref:hypothetical protein n=1 Tax=Streptomyces sp. NPDC058861 TaxID=3346653 RepID=UPI003696FFCF
MAPALVGEAERDASVRRLREFAEQHRHGRNAFERRADHLEGFRRVATGYEKTATSYEAVVSPASFLLRARSGEGGPPSRPWG